MGMFLLKNEFRIHIYFLLVIFFLLIALLDDILPFLVGKARC